jgi:hypothetical protein
LEIAELERAETLDRIELVPRPLEDIASAVICHDLILDSLGFRADLEGINLELSCLFV